MTKQNTKKIISVLISLFIIALFTVGCSNSNQTDENNENQNQNTVEPQSNNTVITNTLLQEAETSMLEALAPLPQKGNGEKIGAIAFSMTNPFWVTVEQGYKDAADEYGVSVEVVASPNEADEQGQADAMTALLSKDFKAFAVSSMTPYALVNPCAEATAKGIPVVAVGTNIDAQAAKEAGAVIEAFVTSDFEQQGYMGAEYIMQQIGGSGKVAVIQGQAGADNSEQRKRGAVKGFEDNGGDVVAVEAADWDRQKAYDIATNILQANPDLQGIMCANDEMALGVVEAMKAANAKDRVMVVGIDFIEEAKESIAQNELDGSVVMSPYLFGKAGLILALKAMEGQTIEEDMFWTPFALVNAENVEQYEGWK